jgi:hypothetical protein
MYLFRLSAVVCRCLYIISWSVECRAPKPSVSTVGGMVVDSKRPVSFSFRASIIERRWSKFRLTRPASRLLANNAILVTAVFFFPRIYCILENESSHFKYQGDGVIQPFAPLNLFVTLSWKQLTILGVLKNCRSQGKLKKKKQVIALHF